jgi:hypothetical protein
VGPAGPPDRLPRHDQHRPARHGITTCNYDLTENDTVRVCIVRSKDGVRNGDWLCSASTKA